MYGKLLREIELNLESISEFQTFRKFDLTFRLWQFKDTPETRKIMTFIIKLAGLKAEEYGESMGDRGPNRLAKAYLGDTKVSIFWGNNYTRFFSVSFQLPNARVHPAASLVRPF